MVLYFVGIPHYLDFDEPMSILLLVGTVTKYGQDRLTKDMLDVGCIIGN